MPAGGKLERMTYRSFCSKTLQSPFLPLHKIRSFSIGKLGGRETRAKRESLLPPPAGSVAVLLPPAYLPGVLRPWTQRRLARPAVAEPAEEPCFRQKAQLYEEQQSRRIHEGDREDRHVVSETV